MVKVMVKVRVRVMVMVRVMVKVRVRVMVRVMVKVIRVHTDEPRTAKQNLFLILSMNKKTICKAEGEGK
jgi:hypothetical protein